MLRKLSLLAIFCLFTIAAQAQLSRYPYTIGYAAGERIEHKGTAAGDTFSISFSGSAPGFDSSWVNALGGGNALGGFRHDLLFVENAFDKELFASKGYYGDFVELRWDLVNYANQVTAFRIYRKEVGSADDSVQVANLAPDARSWRDEYAESGVMYHYSLLAQGIFPVPKKFMNVIEGIGFRVPYGRISGRVTYKGGAAVQGVNIVAETEDNFAGSGIYLNGTDAYLEVSPPLDAPKFKLDTAFTFQAWYRPDGGAGIGTIFEKENQYKISHKTDTVFFTAGGTQTIYLNFTQKADTFFNVTAMRSADSLILYVIYDENNYERKAVQLTAATTANNNEVSMGRSVTGEYLRGYLDEIRIWHKSFTEEKIISQTSRYIEGTESNLTAYYRLNEGVGDHFYDLSRKGFTFNEFHGYKSPTASWNSANVPLQNQLAVKGVTDANGTYIIAGIPYATDGSVYNFVPVFGVHSFDPTNQILFIGAGSTTHSNVNFTDVASFTVIGEVFYKDTYFPVEGVSIKIDGQTAVNSDGTPITTSTLGRFQVDVPIGQHYLQLAKNGHGFENDGRFPAAEGTFFDFQAPYTFQQPFNDTTLVKVIGKVVGGPVQADKPKGLGKTTNNLGQGKIVLGTQKGYDLTNDTTGIDTTLNNESYENATLKDDGDTRIKIIKTSPKQTEIYPDPTTGEYVAYLLPEKYTITSVTAGTYTYDASFHTTLDLTNAILNPQTEIDSVVTGTAFTPLGDTVNTYRVDSIRYHKNQDFIYRVAPSITVTNKQDEIDFWENQVTANDGATVTVVNGDGTPKTPWPIFKQRKSYDVKISVFESYTNNITSITDKVAVTDGVVEIQNALATVTNKQSYKISKLGVVNYSFTAGLPNITGDYTNTMSITALTGKGGSIQTQWNYVNGAYTGPFKAFVFGGMPTGNNFVTTGPNKVDMILRDPYGSGSFAFFEKGKSTTKTSTFSVSDGNSGSENLTIQFGAEVKVFAGVGAGTITETEYNHNVGLGIEHEESWVDENTTTSTTTATQTWATSAEPDFVGANGDIFIGHSTNIVYGISKMIDLIPDTACVGCQPGTGSYEIGIHKALRVNPKFGTAFQFSQNHIKNYLIPNLMEIRDIYLQNSPYHTSHHAVGSEEFGSPNDSLIVQSPIINAGVDTVLNFTGQSYSFSLNVPGDWPRTDSEFVDTVAYYNEQIKNWETLLAQNEKEKLNATTIKNLSFDAGVTYSSSETYENSEATTSTFEFTVSPKISGEIGFEIMGTGSKFEFEESYSHSETKSDGTETTTSVTFGYELSDPDEGDYISMDVKDPGSNFGPVFAVRGGQTQCPHADAEVTEYYQPGKIISEATVQREVPQITCTEPVQINVPEDQPAHFQLQLSNVSQSNDDVWYVLSVDESSNPDGAKITMDGNAIGNGRVIFVPAGEALNKIVSISKTLPAVNDYEDIALVLKSDCQSDPGDDWKDIADTVRVTARFKPVCSKVNITDPLDQWVINTNTGNNMAIEIDDYNLAHTNFEEIHFQYKPTSSSSWITDKKFFVDYADFQADSTAGNNNVYIGDQATLNYTWDMSSLQDRTYDIRAVTTCSDGYEHKSSVLTGIKDSKRPKIFGTPQPGDGILSPGEDVMLTFDEPIEDGLLLSSNFSVRGVLNGAELRHSSSLYFDGTDDYASATSGVNLNNKSFTIEFWTKRQALTEGVLFDQTQLQLGFDAANKFYVKIGGQIETTTTSYGFTDKWIHFTVTYDVENRNVNVYSAYDGHNAIDMQDKNFPSAFQADGGMYIGNNAAKDKPYNGLIHDLRVWEKVIGYGTANANMLVELNGDEIGLSGLWPMNEMEGAFATDLSRAHHAILQGASWRVSPSGYARTFDGASNVVIPTGSSIIITDAMDFTIEFWFKGKAQTNTVLFANGKADGSETASAFENIWNIGFNSDGRLYAKNNGVAITDTDSDWLDDEWHHFALVLRRKGNTSIYVDGNLESFAHSSNFGGLVANQMVIGSNRHYTNGTPYANYFKGSIDEFRAWNLSRTAKLLDLYQHSKLSGDEKGLVAYYPFDKYDVNLILQPSLVDCDINENTGNLTGSVATANGGAFDNTNVPNIADARPVQNLAFNWVVNNDKIIINIDEPASLIEKRVIEFTVDRVEDLRENRMASPETWTAFIRKNTVIWDQKALSFVKKQYDPLSFTVNIMNIGGVDQDYTISNLPPWLTVSEDVGTLAPTDSKTITFTVDPGVNIGTHEEVIYLTSDFGFNESLFITLKVEGEQPNWNLDPADFQYSMNVIGRIEVDDIVSTDSDDRLVAVVNGKVRGLANLAYYEDYDAYLAFIDIYSNTVGGETVEFHVWDASAGKTHTEVTPNITFQENTLQGTPNNPIVFEAVNTYSEPIAVAQGWNWVSFHLKSNDQNNVNNLLSSVSAQDGDIFKSMSLYDQYSSSIGWVGSITANGGVKNNEMYKLNISSKDTIAFVGSKVDPAVTPIPIDSGWNWIGFISQRNLSIEDAFGNYNVGHGDIIKSQLSFAIYDSLLGWVGNLEFLRPKYGYMFQSSKKDTLRYPDSDLFSYKNEGSNAQASINQEFGLNVHAYRYTMNMVASAELCENAANGSYVLVAYHDESIRGVAKSMNDKFYITLYGNEDKEELRFVVVDQYGNRFEMAEKFNFVSDQVFGKIDAPVQLNSMDLAMFDCKNAGPAMTETSDVQVTPNVFTDYIQMGFHLMDEARIKVELFDISGHLISTLIDEVRSEGQHTLRWDTKRAGTSLSPGVYFLTTTVEGESKIVKKIIKAR